MPDFVAEHLARCRRMVADYGWMVMGVLPDEENPGFSYTAGLCLSGRPELVVVGLAPDTAHTCLNEFARRVLVEAPAVGDRWTLEKNRDIEWRFGAVSAAWSRRNLLLPRRLWPGRKFTALQLIWPNDETNDQPLLDNAP